MIISSLTPFTTMEGAGLVATDFWLYSDEARTVLLEERLNNRVGDITKVIWNEKAVAGRKYYGVARVLLETGPTEKVNCEVAVVSNDGVDLDATTMPSPINPPSISSIYDQNCFPQTQFKVVGSKYEVVGNSTHLESIWSITNSITGQLVHEERKTTSLYDFECYKVLDYNTPYVISVQYRGSNNDVSVKTSYPVMVAKKTSKKAIPVVLADESNLIFTLDDDLEYVATTTVKLSNIASGETYTHVFNGTNISVPHTEMADYGSYMATTIVTLNDGTVLPARHHVFIRIKEEPYGFPQGFPYVVGLGKDD